VPGDDSVDNESQHKTKCDLKMNDLFDKVTRPYVHQNVLCVTYLARNVERVGERHKDCLVWLGRIQIPRSGPRLYIDKEKPTDQHFQASLLLRFQCNS
jgi:hypothetical protein